MAGGEGEDTLEELLGNGSSTRRRWWGGGRRGSAVAGAEGSGVVRGVSEGGGSIRRRWRAGSLMGLAVASGEGRVGVVKTTAIKKCSKTGHHCSKVNITAVRNRLNIFAHYTRNWCLYYT